MNPSTLLHLLVEICDSPIVQRVGVSDEGTEGLHVWVQLDVNDEEDEEAIYRSLQAYRATRQSLPIDLHVVLATQPDGVFPNDAQLLYVRQ